jgi:hypothetical protein
VPAGTPPEQVDRGRDGQHDQRIERDGGFHAWA